MQQLSLPKTILELTERPINKFCIHFMMYAFFGLISLFNIAGIAVQ